MSKNPHEVDARLEAAVAVTTRMLAVAERLPGQLALSSLFVQLGAELMRTFSDGTIFMTTTSRKSEAIRQMQWLDYEDVEL